MWNGQTQFTFITKEIIIQREHTPLVDKFIANNETSLLSLKKRKDK